jgi:hypothetical protein
MRIDSASPGMQKMHRHGFGLVVFVPDKNKLFSFCIMMMRRMVMMKVLHLLMFLIVEK